MKILSKISILATLVGCILLFSSCDSDSDPLSEPDLSMVNDDLEMNQAFEDLDFLTISTLESNGLGARTLAQANDDLCSTAKVIKDLVAKKITIDFGAGCTSPNGIIRKGKIFLAYSGNLLFPGSTIITTFEGYEVNGLKIEGTRTLTNLAINPTTKTVTLAVKIQTGKVTWPDNTFVTFVSDQVRTLKLGDLGYEISVTGTASGKTRGGFDYSSLTSTALNIKQTCVESGVYIPTIGILQFTVSSTLFSIDYGNGTCDKLITLTYPGGTKDVTLD